jgi:CheY-like chemotaxis protein
VRQLLTFARKTESLIESVRLNEVIEEMVKLLKETFPKTVALDLKLDKNIPSIVGDANQLHQAFLNISLNARDAMPRGGTLTFTTRTVAGTDCQGRFPDAEKQQYICISVTDTGIGMDEATRRRIFEPFFTTKEKGRGTGLGLSVVYGVVTSHHGFIDVESEVGDGTTFRLYFPIQSHDVVPSTILTTQDKSEVVGGTETLLIAEDEEMLLDLLRGLFAGKGYTVLTARDGIEAVEVYRQHMDKVALVLMDMNLPKLGGWETYLKLKEVNPKAKVIIASGFVGPNLKSEILKAGAKDFVQKPYIPVEILRRVRRVLDHAEK